MALNKPKSAGELVPAAPEQIVVAHTTELETSIQGFSEPLAAYLSSLGLPTKVQFVDNGNQREHRFETFGGVS